MENKARVLFEIASGTLCVPAIGVFDGFSARIAARSGATLLHASGGAIARSIGHPDTGLVTMTEMLGRIGEIAAATDLPVFADADTGYGNVDNAARAARSYRAAGVAGLHVEDQVFPKRCGYMDGVSVIPAQDMVDKVRAMKDAVGDDLLVAARTDAVPVEGLDAALDRMALYFEAGADMAFVESVETLPDLQRTAQALSGVAMVFNQSKASSGGAIQLDQLAANGVRIALYPGDVQRAAAWSMMRTVQAVQDTGETSSEAERMLTNAERDAYFGD